MMASIETLVPEVYHCYHYGSESTDSTFKYFDNKKLDQPRHQCSHCSKFFTIGWHGRPQGRMYAKKRNEDPPEIKCLSRQCHHCGVADNAPFKYYNNHNLSQPRFKCLSCGKQFQMRPLGTGEERRLVHTSCQTRVPRRQKVPEPFPNAVCNSSNDGSYQPFDGSFMPVSADPLTPLETCNDLLPEINDEDAEYVNFLEMELTDKENTQADPLSWTANGDDENYLPPPSDEAAAYWDLVEAEFLTEPENNDSTPNVDAFSSTPTVGGEYMLPPTWSNEDAELMDFIEASAMAPDVCTISDQLVEMVSESTSTNVPEVMYGTSVVDSSTAFDSGSWSQDNSSVGVSSMNYAEAATAVCRQMDVEMEMAHKNSMLAVASGQSTSSEYSSSNESSTMAYADAFHDIPEPLLFEQALTEVEESSDFYWNEDDEARNVTEMTSWVY